MSSLKENLRNFQKRNMVFNEILRYKKKVFAQKFFF